MPSVATGLDPETAQHWVNVLQDSGIAAEISDTGDVVVAEADLAKAKELFADPFGDDGGEEMPPIEAPPLDPNDRTEELGRTDDFAAAQRLASILNSAGLYAAVEQTASSNVLGGEPPAAVVHVAVSQREKAAAVLEAFARENIEAFQGAAKIDPVDVVESLLLAPAGLEPVKK